MIDNNIEVITHNSSLETRHSELSIPTVSISKLTSEIISRTNAIVSLVNEKITIEQVASETGIALPTMYRHLTKLRKLFELPLREKLFMISNHPQLHQAIEYLLTRRDRTDEGSLRSAKDLSVVVPTNGELLSVEDFLKSLYPREGVNASSCYRALRARCINRQIIKSPNHQISQSPNHEIASLEDLPSEQSITRFLRQWREEYISVRRGRARKNDFESQQQPYVTRDVTQYLPGQLWIGDHTELDFMVLNEKGVLDRRWISSFIDIRTGLIIGYHLSWQPNSQTVSLAYRNGVLGSQIKAFNGSAYVQIPLVNVPEEIMIDNGKDYRSNYTQRIFGKIDFEDTARLSIQRMTKLHYTLPYHGQSKAQQERWYKTIQTMLKYLPGYKGNRYQNKPDSLKDEMKQGACLSVDKFDALVAIGINTYNNRVHRSLNEQSPIQCYLSNQPHQRAIDMRVLDFLMLKVQGRKIRRCQVALKNADYYSDALMPYNDKPCDVYYDPNDMGMVSIYVDGEFAAVAVSKEMIGQTERGWEKILHERTRGEKGMQKELQTYRKGISNADAKRMLLEGELMNASPVSRELLMTSAPTITMITGIEQQAAQNKNELDSTAADIEKQKEARKRAKQSPLSLAMVNDRIK
jgi:transposase InsO family protein